MGADDNKKLDELSHDVKELTKAITEYITIVRRHIVEQEKIDRHVDRRFDDHEGRIRTIEDWKAETTARLPQRLIDADQITQDIDRLESANAQINQALAKWGGIALAVWLCVNLVVEPLLKALWASAFGG